MGIENKKLHTTIPELSSVLHLVSRVQTKVPSFSPFTLSGKQKNELHKSATSPRYKQPGDKRSKPISRCISQEKRDTSKKGHNETQLQKVDLEPLQPQVT